MLMGVACMQSCIGIFVRTNTDGVSTEMFVHVSTFSVNSDHDVAASYAGHAAASAMCLLSQHILVTYCVESYTIPAISTHVVYVELLFLVCRNILRQAIVLKAATGTLDRSQQRPSLEPTTNDVMSVLESIFANESYPLCQQNCNKARCIVQAWLLSCVY